MGTTAAATAVVLNSLPESFKVAVGSEPEDGSFVEDAAFGSARFRLLELELLLDDLVLLCSGEEKCPGELIG